ncbi:lanthionine synthetase LanC family protein [Pedobacter suwonensis]|uniref:lanthionine synthetase LanC family protein n=1 Tax=Pedobacter suwonensis TaxID=332999 RepID=UPI0036954322
MENQLTSEIKHILRFIFDTLDTPSFSDNSLMNGKAGHILFMCNYLNYHNINEDQKFSDSFGRLTESLNFITYPGHCTGRSGINWLFSYLTFNNILEKKDNLIIRFKNDELQMECMRLAQMGNYGFLHGAIGVAYAILNSTNLSNNESFFVDLFQRIRTNLLENNGLVHHFDFSILSQDLTRVNLGLAHGITGIIKFCIECQRRGVCKNESASLCKELVLYLRKNVNQNHSVSYFPKMINTRAKSEEINSRLSWCYGDLGISFILYQVGKCFKDTELMSFAVEILEKHAINIANNNEINDIGLCHGRAGILHIFNKMWLLTGRFSFKEASTFCVKKTLKEFNQIKSRLTIKETSNIDDYSLIFGSAGVGLALLSYINSDTEWDDCFFLN